jgi:serine/threonine protein kinase
MDLVFKPDGNFDEVYLYVSPLFPSSSRIAVRHFLSYF